MTKETGGSAFPCQQNQTMDGSWNDTFEEGMTLRDYFAAKAMAALMPIYWETQDEYENAKAMIKCQVESAYEYADAMILQRGK